MTAFLVGALAAIAQVVLLKLLIDALAQKRNSRAFLIFTVKFLLYGTVIALFGFKFSDHIENACYGFIAAFPLTAVLWFVLSIFKVQVKNIFGIIRSKLKKPQD